MKDPFDNSPVRRVTLENLHEFKPYLKRKPEMKNNKKPTWILLDQWHVDLEIKSDMPATERQTLKRKVNEIMNTFFKSNRKNYRLKVSQ